MLSIYLNLIDGPEQCTLFEVMYYEYRRVMFAKAKSILRDDYLSEDAVHTAFVKIAKNFEKNIEKLIPEEKRRKIIRNKCINDECPNIGGYLVIVVKNVCYDMIGKDNRNNVLYYEQDSFLEEGNSLHSVESDAEDAIEEKETVEKIISAIRQLPEPYKDALYMNVVLEMGAREISEELSCSYETARKRVQRGRLKLRDLLAKDVKE